MIIKRFILLWKFDRVDNYSNITLILWDAEEKRQI